MHAPAEGIPQRVKDTKLPGGGKDALGHTDYQTTANIYTHLKSEMMKKSSVDMEDVFRRKQEAKGVLVKAKSAKEKRSRKPAVDASLPWAGRF